jgi:hypothetical protein
VLSTDLTKTTHCYTGGTDYTICLSENLIRIDATLRRFLFIYLCDLYPIITITVLITLLSIYLLGNLHLSQTVSGIKLSQGRKFILSAKVKGCVLGTGVLYDTSETVLLFAPLFKDVFWLNLYSLDTISITDMRRLTTGIRSEKCVVRRFRRCANVYLHKPR